MTTRTRLTAAERTEQIVCAAVTVFSSAGYAGTSTDDVARAAGVSQPYVIRLFGSKQKLFVAAMDYAGGEIERTFRESGETDLGGLGASYKTLLDRYELLGMLLHGFAASGDPEIGEVVRGCFGRIYELVGELTGAEPQEVVDFMAGGMFLTVMGAVRVIGPEAVPPTPWIAEVRAVFPEARCGD